MNTITLKQYNTYILSCSTSQSIGGNPISAAVLSNNEKINLEISNITDTSFTINLDTSLLLIGLLPMDIKIGNVSSDTISLNILRSIA